LFGYKYFSQNILIKSEGKRTVVKIDIVSQTGELARKYHKGVVYSNFPNSLGTALRNWSENYFRERGKIRVLSLFTGGGGLDIGFHDCGFLIDTMVEIDPNFTNTLKENSGKGKYFGSGVKIITDDINKFDGNALGGIDFIIGGPPCQTFSSAGRRAAGVLGFCDPRGLLFEAYVKLLKKLKPKGFLYENVYGLTGAKGGELWKRITSAFEDAGYNIFARTLDAADYGVPQHRERVFIIGVRDGNYKFPRPTHGPDSYCGLSYFSSSNALKGIEVPKNNSEFGGRYGHLLKEIPPGLNYSYFTSKLGHPKPVFAWRSKFSDFLYKADPKMPVRTIKASGGKYTGPLHWDNRHFTIDEMKRLQTFPETYTITGGRGSAVKQIGNSVPPNLARILALSILQQIFNAEIPIKLQYLEPEEKLTFRQIKRELTDYYQQLAKGHHEKIGRLDAISDGKREYYLKMGRNMSLEWAEAKEEGIRATSSIETISGGKTMKVAIKLSDKQKDGIAIRLLPNKWDLPLSQILITSDISRAEDWTSLWKCLEYVIRDIFGIDDLVQLRGYYQYEPSFAIEVNSDIIHREDIFRIMKITAENSISGHILDKNALADKWGIGAEAVLDMAASLKRLGYEIRNSNTNPQIPDNHYLIPYPFPTLNKNSVQFNKRLQ